jgi:hypothetical protein
MRGGADETVKEKLGALLELIQEIQALLPDDDENLLVSSMAINWHAKQNIVDEEETTETLNNLLTFINRAITEDDVWKDLYNQDNSKIIELQNRSNDILSQLGAPANAMNLEGGRRRKTHKTRKGKGTHRRRKQSKRRRSTRR